MKKTGAMLMVFAIVGISYPSSAYRTQSEEVSCSNFGRLDVGNWRCKRAAYKQAKVNAIHDCTERGFKRVKVIKKANSRYHDGAGRAFARTDMVYRCTSPLKGTPTPAQRAQDWQDHCN